MLSFDEKKAAFHSFQLKEREISNGRVNFVYPESRQRGQVLATQLHPSGNGYVSGKYMSEETIQHHGYKVDPRGWISIRDFSEEELNKVISEAMKSMAGEHVETVLAETSVPVKDEAVNVVVPEHNNDGNSEFPEEDDSLKVLEQYPCSYMFFWLGLTLSTMEMSSLMWRSALRKIGDKRRDKTYKPKYFGRLFS